MTLLTNELWFPNPDDATEDGLLAIGGDLSPDRLLLAYESGIFPWFEEHNLIFWFCPPARMVLFPEEVHVSKSMRKQLRSGEFQVTEDQAFERVIRSCSEYHRLKNSGTWISEDFITAYNNLYQIGRAHSIEIWQSGQLAGGMYGISIGKIFCGESMFSDLPNASKAALIHACQSGKYSLIDCQVPNAHLSSMGGRLISRNEFLILLKKLKDDRG